MSFILTTADHFRFTLLKDTQEIATLKYNRESHSIRIHSAGRRVFFLSQEGFLQNKILLKTEYGVEIGENYHIKNHNKGILHLAETKFHYIVRKDGFDIYDKRKSFLVNFRLDGADALGGYEISAILFGLMWMFVHSEITAIAAHKASALYAS